MSHLGRLFDKSKGVMIPSNALTPIAESSYKDIISLADPVRISEVYSSKILEAPVPLNIEFKKRHSSYFVEQYSRASYYFYHCSIFPTVVLRIIQETMKNGIEWSAHFQSKCPNCKTEYPRSTKKCKVCGFEGDMMIPDESQKKLLINWEGYSLMDCVNKNDWDLVQLCESFLTLALVYNQPIILCRSQYIVDAHENVLDEIPLEFIPISPTKARMLYNDRGEPGNGHGFHLSDRYVEVPLDDPEILTTGYKDGLRYYPSRWIISEVDGGGAEGEGEFYARQEIYHKVFGVQSLTYGTPLILLVEADARAWMAMELRVEKYYSTGHPQGIFVINNATQDTLITVQQSIRLQMKEDPYTMPIIGIPPASDKANSTKWHPLADNPTEQMIKVKAELQQRIASIFGVSGIYTGDTNSIKGNTNEAHQMDIMDRNLVRMRALVNGFLKWIVHKYKGINDWDLKLKEPPDEQAMNDADLFNKQLMNASLAKDLGFDIISQANGVIEISDTPKSYDPLKAILGEDEEDTGGSSVGKYKYNTGGTQMGGSRYLSKDKQPNGDKLMSATKGIPADKVGIVLASMIKNGVDIL